MTSAMLDRSQVAVDEIGRYIVTVINSPELCDSSDGYLSYMFGNRDFLDVVKVACENPEMNAQLSEKILSGIAHLNSQIVDYTKKIEENRLSKERSKELQNMLETFYELEQALRQFEQLNNEEIANYVECTKEAVSESYEISKDLPLWKNLKARVFQDFTNDQSREDERESSIEPTTYARPDGVITSLSFTKAHNDGENKRNIFVAKVEKVLKNFIGKNPDLRTMKELVEMKTDFELDGMECDKLIETFIDVWDLVFGIGTAPESHFSFSNLLKKFYLLIPAEKKEILTKKLFKKFQPALPSLENYIENYQFGLTAAINNLPTDHQMVNANPEKFEKLKVELLWYLLVTPITALYQILITCVTNKAVVPIMIRVCRSIPTLFEAKVKCLDVTSDAHTVEPVLVSTLKLIFAKGREEFSAEQWDNVSYVALSFNKHKPALKDSPTEKEESLLTSYQLINLAIREVLKDGKGKERTSKVTETFMVILSRLLANNTKNRETAHFEFSGKMGHINEDGVIPTPELLKCLYDLLLVNDPLPNNISDLCRETIKSIGGRLQENGVIFDKDVVEIFSEHWLNNGSWWLKYAIFSWYARSLNNIKRQIPSGLYIPLPESEKDNFEQIKTSDKASAVECYLRSFFELALFDADLAIELLSKGYEKGMKDIDVIDKMALALVDSYGEKLSKKRGGYDVPKLLKRMLEILNPSSSFNQLAVYSKYLFEAIIKSQYLYVLSKAVMIALEKKLQDDRIRTENPFTKALSSSEIASQLLEVYCETAKKHVEKQMEEAADLQTQARKAVFETRDNETGWKLKRMQEGIEQTLIFELDSIFTHSVGITRMMTQIPVKLQQLLVTLVSNLPKLQKSATNRTLDDELTETVVNDVVYAYTQSLPPIAPERKEPVQPVVQQQQQYQYQPTTEFVPKSSVSETSFSRPAAAVAPQKHQHHAYSAENGLFDAGVLGNGNYHHSQGSSSSGQQRNYHQYQHHNPHHSYHSEDEGGRGHPAYRNQNQERRVENNSREHRNSGPSRYPHPQSSGLNNNAGRPPRSGGQTGPVVQSSYSNNNMSNRKSLNDPQLLAPRDRNQFNAESWNNTKKDYDNGGGDRRKPHQQQMLANRDGFGRGGSNDGRDYEGNSRHDERRTKSEREEYAAMKDNIQRDYDNFQNSSGPSSSYAYQQQNRSPYRSRHSSINETIKMIPSSDARNRVNDQYATNSQPSENRGNYNYNNSRGVPRMPPGRGRNIPKIRD